MSLKTIPLSFLVHRRYNINACTQVVVETQNTSMNLEMSMLGLLDTYVKKHLRYETKFSGALNNHS